MDRKIAAVIFGAVFGAVSLLMPAAFAIPGVDEITDTATDTVTDTVDDVSSGTNQTVDKVTDNVDESTGGNSGGVTDTVDDVVEGVDQATGGAVTGTGGNVGKVFEDPLNHLTNPLGFRDRNGDGKLSKKERRELRESGGLTGKQIAALEDALRSAQAEARVAILDRREGVRKTAPFALDAMTSPVTGSPESALSQLAQAAGEAAKKLAFPMALTMMVLAFLAVQGRIDGRDEKLALAPIDAEQDLLSFS